MRHLITQVDFTGARRMGLPGTDAKLDCACGWTGQAGSFAAHRSEHGEKAHNTRYVPDLSAAIARGP